MSSEPLRVLWNYDLKKDRVCSIVRMNQRAFSIWGTCAISLFNK